MSKPVVSVLMPVRNGERFLAAAIESVFSQGLSDIELVIVNDASEDRTATVLASFIDPRVRVIHLDTSVGTSGALNVGLNVCSADLVARLDADDLCRPGRLAAQTEMMRTRADLLALGGGAFLIDEKGRTIGERSEPTGDAVLARLRWRNPFIHSSVMYRTVVVRELGAYSSRCRRCQDYELWLRIAAIGKLDNLATPVVDYRVHAGQATAAKIKDLEMFKAIEEARVGLARSRGESILAAKVRHRAWLLAQWRGDRRRT
jgi:glycosyltransferase involved in cell wall biosynthesis